MSTWIDFKQLRSDLKLLALFEYFQVKMTIKGNRANGFCPLPTHQGRRNSPSFSADLSRGIWQCFGCHAMGNSLDFTCRMLGFDPKNSQHVRQAALKIMEIFHLDSQPPTDPVKSPAPVPATSEQVLVNEPIDFELKTLDPDHPYLKERGFTEETIRHFGLGFCNRGMLKGRIAIPLHDPQGRLVGYAGRLTKDREISERNPKYLFPGERERNGVKLVFRKSLLLYNAHRIKGPVDNLIVVEGFASTWWLWQLDYPNTVALMGADCSEMQATLIADLVRPDGKVWIMTDGDAAGERCGETILRLVAKERAVRWVAMRPDEQPTDFPIGDILFNS